MRGIERSRESVLVMYIERLKERERRVCEYVIYIERLGERVGQKEKVCVFDVDIEIERKSVWEIN